MPNPNLNTLSSEFSGDVSVYIAKKLLMLALKELVMYQLCEKPKQPHNHGRTFQFTRYERVALPQSPLSEGVTPDGTKMSISVVQAVLDQWGAYVTLTDVAIDSVTHPVLQQGINLTKMQAVETLDREAVKVAIAGTNVYFPDSVVARGSLGASNKLDTDVIGEVTASLRDYGAHAFDGSGNFVMVVDAFAEEDIIRDGTFVNAAVYSAVKKLFVNEVGTWKGCRVVRSNALPTMRYIAGSAAKASSATAGSLTASTTYDFKLTIVDSMTGYEKHVGPVESQATAGGETSLDITMPSLPASASPGSTFNLYFGTNGGTLYLAQSGLAAGAVVNHGTVPTSGDVAPASPPSGGTVVHFSFVLGKEAMVSAELNKIRAYLTPNAPSDSDPLVQRRKVGWKCDFKVFIANESFMARIEHATAVNA